MSKAKIAVLVIFLAFVATSGVVELRWNRQLLTDDARNYWQYRVVTAAVLMIGVQALLEWIENRPSDGGPRKPGFPVVPRRKD